MPRNQMYVRVGGVASVLGALVLLVSACAPDASSPVALNAAFAKGGAPGPPGGAPGPTLEEYWIFPDGSGGNLIHVAGTGQVDAVNPSVVFDHFFNGIRDDNAPSDEHYEYQYGGPLSTDVIVSGGGWHVDIAWNGDRGARGPYRDALITDIGGGADPFTFGLRFLSNGNSVGGEQPQGVIIDGVPGPPMASVTSAFASHGPQDVTSYASFRGAAPDRLVTIESLVQSNVSCTVSKGRGKKTGAVTVSADYVITLDGITPPPGNVSSIAWLERHLVVNGAIGPRQAGGTQTLIESGTLSVAVDGSPASVDVQVVVDYVYPITEFADWAYDPASNQASTTAGLGGEQWTVAMKVNDGKVPVVATAPAPATCS